MLLRLVKEGGCDNPRLGRDSTAGSFPREGAAILVIARGGEGAAIAARDMVLLLSLPREGVAILVIGRGGECAAPCHLRAMGEV